MQEQENTTISKKGPVTLVRNLEILEQVACGPITQEELQRLCFSKKDPITGEWAGVCSYNNMRRILKRLIKASYLKRKKYRADASSTKINSVYVLGEAGIPEVCNHLGWEPEHIRRTFPRQSVLIREITLSSVIRAIIKEAASTKRYKIDIICDSRAYRKMYPSGTRKNTYLPDAYISILPSNPNVKMMSNKGRLELMIAIDTGRETLSEWNKKLKSCEGHNVLFIFLTEQRKTRLLEYINASKKLQDVFCAVYSDFYKYGLTNTTWECINTGNREIVKLPL